MLEQSHRLGLDQILDHDLQHINDGIEPLVGVANIIQAHLVEQNFLNNKNSDRLGKLGAMLHDPKAQRNDFGGEEEVDHLHVVRRRRGFVPCRLDEGADDPQRGQAEVFERARFRGCIEEWVEEQGEVCYRTSQ